MADKTILDLRSVSNAELLDAVRDDLSMEYQSRIPAATQAGIAQVASGLFDNLPLWNEFVNGFINRIGSIYARSQVWTNPLAMFKKGLMNYGDTVEEYMADLLESYAYDPDRNYGEKILFAQERPGVQVNYHRINRQDMYKVTINEAMLRRAFKDEGGLAKLISSIMDAPTKSDQWDEFLLMSNLIRENEKNGGFFKVHTPDFANLDMNQEDARGAMKSLRAMAYRLPILSRQYNAAGMPVAANPDDLILIGTPNYLASIDVDGLAPIFHIDKANFVAKKTIAIPEEYIGVNGFQAMLTTSDFFMVFDTLLENRSMPNPAGLYTNFFLHHHGIVSLSRFVPAIMLTSDSGTVTIREAFEVDSVANIKAFDTDETEAIDEVKRGEIYSLTADVTTTPAGHNVAVGWSVSGADSARTYVTRHGVLYVSPSETADTLTVKAHAVFTDPDNPRLDAPSVTATFDVTGDIMRDWPASDKGIAKITIAGANVPSVDPATTTYSLALPANTTVTKNDVQVHTYGSADVTVTVTKVTGGYTVKISVDSGVGAATDYTVNVTNT